MTDHRPHSATPSPTPVGLERLLNEAEAAEFLGYTQRALQNWRVRGGGPAYVKVSARSIRYQMSALLAWINERTIRHSSQASA